MNKTMSKSYVAVLVLMLALPRLGQAQSESCTPDQEVLVQVLNVYDQDPDFRPKFLFFGWELKLGQKIDVLQLGDRVQRLDTDFVPFDQEWALVCYERGGLRKEGWVIVRYKTRRYVTPISAQSNTQDGSRGSWSVIGAAFAQETSADNTERRSPEEGLRRQSERYIEIIFLAIVIGIFFLCFRHFGIKKDKWKLITSVTLSIFAIYVGGFITFYEVTAILGSIIKAVVPTS